MGVNTLALSSEYVLRTVAFDHTHKQYSSPEEMKEAAFERYIKMEGNTPERLVSGSDDFTMILWEPAVSKHHKTRLTGHQQATATYTKNYVLQDQVEMEYWLKCQLQGLDSDIPHNTMNYVEDQCYSIEAIPWGLLNHLKRTRVQLQLINLTMACPRLRTRMRQFWNTAAAFPNIKSVLP